MMKRKKKKELGWNQYSWESQYLKINHPFFFYFIILVMKWPRIYDAWNGQERQINIAWEGGGGEEVDEPGAWDEEKGHREEAADLEGFHLLLLWLYLLNAYSVNYSF